MKIPVLIIGYARPAGVLRILDALKNHDANIYVSVDGQKSESEHSKAREFDNVIKYYLDQNPNKKIKYRQRSKNVGAAVNVIDSIDTCFEIEESLIILEDDLIISTDFLKFVEFFIPLMQSNEQVKMIAGTNPFPETTNQDRILWSSYPVVWGWATSKSNWIEMRRAIFDQRINRKNFENRWTFNFFRAGKNQSLKGFVDAWDLPLAGSFHAQDWKTLMPPVNLISNIGFDEGATHTVEKVWPLGLSIENLNWNKLKLMDTTLDNSLCLDLKMEKEIYKIKKIHILSLLKSRLWQIIFKPKIDLLKLRIQNTSSTKRSGQ